MSSIDWPAFLLSQLWNLPYLMVYLVGGVLCVVFWRRHPMVSILSLGAFLILIGGTLAWSAAQFWQMGAMQGGAPYADIAKILSIVGGIRAVFGLIAWALLLTALFGWRTAPASATPNAPALPNAPVHPGAPAQPMA